MVCQKNGETSYTFHFQYQPQVLIWRSFRDVMASQKMLQN